MDAGNELAIEDVILSSIIYIWTELFTTELNFLEFNLDNDEVDVL